VGGGVLAIDVLEDPQRGYLVNEINHTMEYHTLAPMTGVDVPGIIVDYALAIGSGKITPQLPALTTPALPQGFFALGLTGFAHTAAGQKVKNGNGRVVEELTV
jgi:hypothetical protein